MGNQSRNGVLMRDTHVMWLMISAVDVTVDCGKGQTTSVAGKSPISLVQVETAHPCRMLRAENLSVILYCRPQVSSISAFGTVCNTQVRTGNSIEPAGELTLGRIGAVSRSSHVK
eukprot:TRINITY_DN24184_c0_g1_i1.p1 TRINITY_DN24184_c0_g1~~TRINITY_DN24184_c0_g1_i1.p1  ORF type:complete len:115 (-),score=2.26 TRINITY_DN24184_c0_g1_i1:417-761(-)